MSEEENEVTTKSRRPISSWETRKVLMNARPLRRKKFDESPELSPFSAMLKEKPRGQPVPGSPLSSHLKSETTISVRDDLYNMEESDEVTIFPLHALELSEVSQKTILSPIDNDTTTESSEKIKKDDQNTDVDYHEDLYEERRKQESEAEDDENEHSEEQHETQYHWTPSLNNNFAGGAGCPIIQSPLIEYMSPDQYHSMTLKDKVLAISGQRDVIKIEDFFTPVMKRTLKKLGEGVFGEVFSCYTPEGEGLAVKIMPIEGKEFINDEKQKTFGEILPEMVISKELSDLGKDETAPHYTRNFVQLYKMGICTGSYPDFLLEAWDLWDEKEESENDRPDVFLDDQLYAVFAFENAGQALEAFTFHTAREAKSVVAQIAGTLAVGESGRQFEHRDMHRGNILVRRTKEDDMVFVIDSHRYVIPSEGVHVTVIDYTLSRLSQGNCVSYNDLNNLPWLFKGHGDIQHQTYVHMQNCTNNDWSKFAPKTNAYWLHYIVNKIAIKSRVKSITKRQVQSALRPFLNVFPSYESAKQIFMEFFSQPSPLRDNQHKLRHRRK